MIQGISKALNSDKLDYHDSRAIWSEVQVEVPNRFSGASYEKLEANRVQGLQWPIHEEETPILHLESFRTKDGLGALSL